MQKNYKNKKILVTGSTGYIGGRLVPRLLRAGYSVRAIARSIEKIAGRTWAEQPGIELIQGDLLDPKSLENVFNGCFASYYLVHSMNPDHKDFDTADQEAAKNFVEVSRDTSLERIVYLGGLGSEQLNTSPHLKSRQEVGEILKNGPVPVTIFRSAHILGSGSASFEMLRYMSERFPFYIVPGRISHTKIQPICIRNVLDYLVECLEINETLNQTYDIGGPEVLTYRDLFEIYAEAADLRRPIFINPLIPPFTLGTKLSIVIAKLFLPLSPSISKPLLEGLPVETVVQNDRIKYIIPQNLMSCREAINRAIQKDSLKIVETRWTDAGYLNPPEWMYAGDPPYSGGTLLQSGYKIGLDCEPKDIWPMISRIGGMNGWYYGDIFWQVRGLMDRLAGGVGLRRGRRHPDELYIGDAIDFWRVLDVKPLNHLILLAEMRLPGEEILNFEIVSVEIGVELRLDTRFRPIGLFGILYWYSLLPFRNLLFGGMLKEIAKKIKKTIISGPERYEPNRFSDYRYQR